MTWPADGEIGQLTLSAPSNCEWAAEWNVPWVTPLQTSGAGNSSVSYAIDRNDSGVARSGSLAVGGATVSIAQTTVFVNGPPAGGSGSGGGSSSGGGSNGGGNSTPAFYCAVTMTPTAFRLPSGGGSGLLAINADSACAWRVQGVDAWLTVSPLSGVGPAWLTVSADSANASRFGRIYVSGQAIAVVMQTRPQQAGVVRPYSGGSCWDMNVNIDSFGEIEGCFLDGEGDEQECAFAGLNAQGIPVLECESEVVGTNPSPDPVLPTTDWCDLLPGWCSEPPPDPCATGPCQAPNSDPQPPFLEASVELRCRPVSGWWGLIGLVADHCYVKIWDPDSVGHLQTVEGWERDFHPDGTLVMQAYDGWPLGDNRETDQVYYRSHSTNQTVLTCLKYMAGRINAAKGPYHANGGPNSNSAIATALEYCDIPARLSQDAVGRDKRVIY